MSEASRARQLAEAARAAVDEVFASPHAAFALDAVGQVGDSLVALVHEDRAAVGEVRRAARGPGGDAAHALGVATIAVGIAHLLGLSTAFRRKLAKGALLHDLGKSLLPPELLAKDAPLDDAEWQVVRQHPKLGVDLLTVHGPLDEIVRSAVMRHHERLDGSGYPYALEGAAVDLPARLVAVADVYDALTSARPDRGALRADEALRLMREALCGGLDPELLSALAALPLGACGADPRDPGAA